MKCRSPPRVHVESSDSAGGGAACSCATVALWETLWKSKEQPESSLALGSPGAECQWWPRGMSKDRNPMVCLKFLHLSCSLFAGSQGQWGARNFRPSEAEILLQPQGDSSRSAAPLCFPSWSSTRRQPSKLIGPAHVLLPLTCMQALHPY